MVSLVSFFLLPFALIPGFMLIGETFFTTFSSTAVNLPQLAGTGSISMLTAPLLIIIAGALLFVAGLVGAFPLGSGVLGTFGMAILTFSRFLPDGLAPFSMSSYASGFYIMWAASILAIVASFLGTAPSSFEEDIGELSDNFRYI